MSQNSLILPTTGTLSGLTAVQDINNGLDTLVTLNSGASEPSVKSAFMLWADTTAGLLKIRNAANSAWITIGTLASPNLGITSFKMGTFTRDVSVASGTTTFAHGGGIAPKAVVFFGSSTTATATWGAGIVGGAAQMSYKRSDEANFRSRAGSAVGFFVDGANIQEGNPTSADATNVTMTWTKTGAPTGTLNVDWFALF